MAVYDVLEVLEWNQTTAPVKATGTVDLADAGDDLDTLVLDDGINAAITFELLDDVGDLTGDVAVQIDQDGLTHLTLATLIEAINAQRSGGGLRMVATDTSVQADAVITFTTDNPTDGAILRVTDYEGTVVDYEFSAAGGGVTGDVQVLSGATHLTAAANFAAAVNLNAQKVTAVDDLAGVVTLTQDQATIDGNVASDPSEVVADANIAITDPWDTGESSLLLTHDVAGTIGNETILETGDTFTVSGMASGAIGVYGITQDAGITTPEFSLERYPDGSIAFTEYSAAGDPEQRIHSNHYLMGRLFDSLKAVINAD